VKLASKFNEASRINWIFLLSQFPDGIEKHNPPKAEVRLGLSAIFSWRVSSPKYFRGLPHIKQEQTVLFFAR
jgi:hypothetical protein